MRAARRPPRPRGDTRPGTTSGRRRWWSRLSAGTSSPYQPGALRAWTFATRWMLSGSRGRPKRESAMAIIEVKDPQLSESVSEATLLDWHKKEGEKVSRDENLIDIETDKVVLELPAPADGALIKILKTAKDSVGSGDVIAQIDTEGKASAAAPASAAKPAAAPSAAAQKAVM